MMSRRYYFAPIILTMLVVGAWLVSKPQVVRALSVCLDSQTRGDGSNCSTGDVCEGGVPNGQCSQFQISLTAPFANATSASVFIDSNALVQPTYQIYSCLGTTVVCGKPSTNPTNWTNLGSTSGNTFTTNGLRPGRKYTISYAGVFQGVESVVSQTYSTWPLPQPTATVTSLTAVSAKVNWTTTFSGSSDIIYGLVPPTWYSENLPVLASDITTAVAGVSSGRAWATTALGYIFQRQSNGSWLSQTNPDRVSPPPGGVRKPVNVDAYDQNNAWIVGLSGLTLRTVDGGTTWQSISLPAGAQTDLYSVIVTSPSTAWAAGANGLIYFFNGTTWQKLTTVAGAQTIRSISTINSLDVWVGDSAAKVFHSTNGGTTWSAATTLGAAGESIYSLASVDNQTIWAAGSNGKLWRYTTASGTWSSISNPAAGGIYDLKTLSDTELWFASQSGTGHITNATSASPSITVDSSINSILGQTPNGLAVVNGAHIIALSNQGAVDYEVQGVPQSGPAATAHTLNLTGLSQGTTYFFSAESYGSGVGTGVTGNFVTPQPDTIPPTIALTDPASGTAYTQGNSYIIKGTINDNQNLDSLTCEDADNHTTVPGVTVVPSLPFSNGGAAVSATWQANVFLGATDGTHHYDCTVYDGTSGHQATVNAIIIRDNAGPTLSVDTPGGLDAVTCLDGYYQVNASPVTMGGDVSDPSGVDHLTYRLNSGATVNIPAPSSGTRWTSSVNGLLPGPNNRVDITAFDNAGNSTVYNACLDYAQPDFSLTAAPATQTKFVGDAVSYTVTATSKNGFAGAIALSAVTGSPSLSASFSPATITLTAGGTGTATFNLNTAAASGGTYNMTITGTSGGLTQTMSVQLILNAAPSFTLSATPSPLSIVAGNSNNYQVTVSSNPTFAGPITFSVTGLPTGVTGVFAPTGVTLASSQTNSTIRLNITTQASVANGDYPLTITGTGTNTANGAIITQLSNVILHISPAPAIGLTFSPASQSIAAGDAGTSYNGTVSSLNGLFGTVNLSVASNPANAGLTLTLAPSSVVLAAGDVTNVALNAVAAHSVPGGTYVLTITATNGSGPSTVTQTATVNLVVAEDTAPPVISGITISPNYNNVRVSWTTDEPANSSMIIYADAAHTVGPIPVSNLSTFCTSTCHNLFDTPLNPSTTYYLVISSTDTAPTPHTTTVMTDAGGAPLQFTTLDAPDTIIPVVVFDQPADATSVVGTVSISGSATDDKNVQQINVTILGPAGRQDVTVPCLGPSCTYSWSWNTLATGPVGVGSTTVTVVAQDKAGNLSLPISHTVSVDNDFTAPRLTSGPTADNLVCDSTAPAATACQITINWATDDQATSEVGFQIGPPYCDPVSGVCAYSDHQQYDDAAPSDSSANYTIHQVTLKNLSRNQLYHYQVYSCNRSGLCLQGG